MIKTFKKYTIITEGKLATNFEAFITVAFNGGPSKDPETLEVNRISVAEYKKYEKEAKAIAKVIKSTTRAKGKMVHYGSGAGQVAAWWDGKGTPKTDIYVGDVRISLKEAGGSQLLSAKKGEALSTFKAAMEYMGGGNRQVAMLGNRLEKVMQDITLPKQGPIISYFQNQIKTKGIKGVAKHLKDTAERWIYAEENKARMTTELKKFFNENEEFRTWFVFEAATGLTKFSPEGRKGKPISNWVVKFDTSGNVHEIESLMTTKYKPTSYVKKLGSKIGFRISWKTPSSKGRKTYISLRGDIFKEDTIDSIINKFILKEQELFEESSYLTEDSIISKLTNLLSKIINGILSKISAMAKKGMGSLMDFLGIGISSVEVIGLDY